MKEELLWNEFYFFHFNFIPVKIEPLEDDNYS